MRCQRFFMLLIATIVALSVSSAFVAAQSAIKPMKDLSVGNRWVYGVTSIDSGSQLGNPFNHSSSSVFYEEVLKDSLFLGKRYSQIYSSFDNTLRWERADDKTLFIWSNSHEVASFSFDSVYINAATYMYPLGGLWCTDTKSLCSSNGLRVSDSARTTILLSRPSVIGQSTFINDKLQYNRYTGIISISEQTKQDVYFYPRASVSQVLYLSRTTVKNITLQGCKLRDTLWGDTSIKVFTISLPLQTLIRPNTIQQIPLQLTGIRSLQEVFTTPPTITLTFNRNIVEAVDTSNAVVIDSSDVPANTIIRITPPLNSTTLSTLQFRMRSDAIDTIAPLQLGMTSVSSSAPYQQSVQSGSIIFERPTFILQTILPSLQGRQGSKVDAVVVLRGTQELAKYGIQRIQTHLKFPSFIARPENAFSTQGSLSIVPITFNLSTSIDTVSTQVRLLLTADSDTTASLMLENMLPLPNAVRLNTSVNSAQIHVIRPNLVVQLAAENISAKPDEIIHIPFTITLSENLSQYGLDALKLNFLLNASMLEPIGIAPGTVSKGIRSIPILLPLPSKAISNQIVLTFRAAIGSTVATQIIPELQPIDGINTKLFTNGGLVRLATNSAGGTPLVFYSNRSSQIVIEQISPNPAKDEISISYTLRTDTPLEIMLFDIQGNKVRTLAPLAEQKAGTFTLTARTDNVVSGQYRVVLQAPRGSVQAQINVIR